MRLGPKNPPGESTQRMRPRGSEERHESSGSTSLPAQAPNGPSSFGPLFGLDLAGFWFAHLVPLCLSPYRSSVAFLRVAWVDYMASSVSLSQSSFASFGAAPELPGDRLRSSVPRGSRNCPWGNQRKRRSPLGLSCLVVMHSR